MMDRLRVAALQYHLRPVQSFEQFSEQVTGLVATAKDYRCHLVVFPEYFSLQLLTLGDLRLPIAEQIRNLTTYVPRFVALMSDLAQRHGLYIVAGSVPTAGEAAGVVHNDCYFFNPAGSHGVQGKLHMTRFESEEWLVTGRDRLTLFDTDFGRVAITICYDVEFPELARAAAQAGATILIVPSCTDDRHGFLRVRTCAQARAIENQMYVIHAAVVGSLPMLPAVALNYGQAAILTPCDYAFARDGILAEGALNHETMVIGDLDLAALMEARASGTVRPLQDSRQSAAFAANLDVIAL
ncbi:MAG TPA: carbon-nitrogen hydrolase family protein [Anaerolineae bacterium]|nr:carbon-nitrogen hydrolase family protein [Anaerolineae bacterium]